MQKVACILEGRAMQRWGEDKTKSTCLADAALGSIVWNFCVFQD